jgi:hypothetical protein
MTIVHPYTGDGNAANRLRVAEQILRLFRGRDQFLAVGTETGFRPQALTAPLSAERLAAEHLGRKRCLAFYLLTPDNSVWCSCVDFDNKPDRPDPEWKNKTEHAHRFLVQHGLTPLVEISQSGMAAHIWIFFRQPIPAWVPRALWRGVFAILRVPVTEIYPRQDRLSGKGLGNAVRYPFWRKSHLVDINAGWQPIPPLRAMAAVSPISASDLKRAAATMQIDLQPAPKPAPVAQCGNTGTAGLSPRVRRLLEEDDDLADRWNGNTNGLRDTSRSALLLSIACMLVHRHVATAEIEEAIRYWCKERRYEKGDRDDWITGLLASAYEFVGNGTGRFRRTETIEAPPGAPDVIKRAFARAIAGTVSRNTRSRRENRSR